MGTPYVLFTGAQWSILLLLIVIGAALRFGVVSWIFRDVRSSGRNPWPWAASGAVFAIPTTLVWRFMRPAPAPAQRAAPEPPAHPAATPPTPEPPRAAFDPYAAHPPRGDGRIVTGAEQTTVSCPRCMTQFPVTRAPYGATEVTCPSCGTRGRL